MEFTFSFFVVFHLIDDLKVIFRQPFFFLPLLKSSFPARFLLFFLLTFLATDFLIDGIISNDEVFIFLIEFVIVLILVVVIQRGWVVLALVFRQVLFILLHF